MLVCPCLSLDSDCSWSCSLSKISIRCHSNKFFVTHHKPPDGLKTRVDIWKIMDVVPVEYGTFAQTFQLTIWLFHLLMGLTSSGIICCVVLLIFLFLLVFGKIEDL